MNYLFRHSSIATEQSQASGTGALKSKRTFRQRLLLLLIAADIVSIYLGFFLAAAIYNIIDYGHWIAMATALFPIYLLGAAKSRAYSGEILLFRGVGTPRALNAFFTSIGILTLSVFLLKISDDFSRVNFAVGSLFVLVLLVLSREMFVRVLRHVLHGEPYSAVLIADGSTAHPPGNFTSVISAESWLDPDSDCPKMYDRLANALGGADRVVIACAPERRERWAHALKGANIRSEVIAPELAGLAPLAISASSTTPTLVIADGPLGPFNEFMKRCFDIVTASLALVLLAPVMLVVAIAIKMESPGAVLFIQERIGRGNRVFRMLKFRSMHTRQLDHNASKLVTRNDARVTRVGRFIRRTSLDELPQLFNVLWGQMSIVGPRPHALGATANQKLYWEVDARYWHRHAVKPGLTGLAQVRGLRGNTEREQDLTKRLHADLEYLHGWSIWRDVLIVLRTFYALASNRAY
ncbi:exopolysaccharide biosynthesis polyprenyl glycosylphosphotransferase [Stakelama tenebrarum]|uniref:Exopolysaccharide biosynthesis polyprenyl glycosylphosphotransferase n=1 Tax=Stakelama tenebrarum TaxID=2711215 RepID=A0A6G6Y4K2_9SPHN|nr:exopolysaccharide biosynthesis polyprenyl glycosylphosphotransferase [Sphingosinithalassobacter tenebrarum]QIG79533.1 exopolysaccharide biosynthesis polyprenyl glycosylphosphotransferase [Sphingosinithalassobacter tenebrarum]